MGLLYFTFTFTFTMLFSVELVKTLRIIDHRYICFVLRMYLLTTHLSANSLFYTVIMYAYKHTTATHRATSRTHSV